MPNARSLLAAVVSMLSLATLAAGADPAVASPSSSARAAGASPRARIAGRHRRRAGATCANSSRRSSRRARRATGACKTETHKRAQAKLRRRERIAPRRSAGTPDATSPKTPPTPLPVAGRPSAASDAATIATALATQCQNTELAPEAGNIALIRAAVLCLINHKRAENGENPLTISAQLEQAAEGHCQELISEDYFAHVSPSGETPVDRIRTTGYIPGPSVGYVIGENLAWGTYQLATAQAIASAWFASPGHLANILEAQYRETGIGVVPTVPASLAGGSPGATYAQEFGVIIR